jgi:hypothetical protein
VARSARCRGASRRSTIPVAMIARPSRIPLSQWVLLPLAWLLGDIVFWYLFAARINAFGHSRGSRHFLSCWGHQLAGPCASAISILSALSS